MIKTSFFSLTVLLLLVLSACGSSSRRSDSTPPSAETPKALQDDGAGFTVKSYSGRGAGNLAEQLYSELVEKTPALKALEDDLEALQEKSGAPAEKFNTYDAKSKNYYSSVENMTGRFSDSLLKNRILDVINRSKSRYEGRTAELAALMQTIERNNMTLQDHHAVLKIMLTLGVIEKYQQDNLPGKEASRAVIKEQEGLLRRTDSLTPAY